MARVASRDLRNHTADVLRRVALGERVEVTVRGDVVAEISAVTARRPAYLRQADLVALLSTRTADAGLRADLERLVGDSTDDLADDLAEGLTDGRGGRS